MDHRGRVGELDLGRGVIETPVFMPVGTQGVMKLLSWEEVGGLGYGLILSNAYHLYLRPGEEVLKVFGGLHGFSGWGGNILTDSGGYQVMSLGGLVRVHRDGVEFKSHIDGSFKRLDARKILDFQEVIGSEIKMPLDVCSGYGVGYDRVKEEGELTLEWARESKEHFMRVGSGSLFGIVQGGMERGLREESMEVLKGLDFDGYAIGGLSVGEGKEVTRAMIDFITEGLPEDKPRYMMGLGKPEDLLMGVELGVDMFDSIYPTRVGRNGGVFTRRGLESLKKSEYRMDSEPIDLECGCLACLRYSRGYLRHLLKSGEVLGMRLASLHNLYYLKRFMEKMRKAILEDKFQELKVELKKEWAGYII